MSNEAKKKAQAGILVVTHLNLGDELIKAAQFIVGPQDNCSAMSIETIDNVDEVIEKLKVALRSVDTGGGAVILTDMFGGTPTNLSLSLAGTENIEVITGVNLPMVIKAFQSRHLPLSNLGEEIKKAGVSGIKFAGGMLKSKKGSSKASH